MTHSELYVAFTKLPSIEKDFIMVEVFSKFECVENHGHTFTPEQFFNILEKAVASKEPIKSEYMIDDVFVDEGLLV